MGVAESSSILNRQWLRRYVEDSLISIVVRKRVGSAYVTYERVRAHPRVPPPTTVYLFAEAEAGAARRPARAASPPAPPPRPPARLFVRELVTTGSPACPPITGSSAL